LTGGGGRGEEETLGIHGVSGNYRARGSHWSLCTRTCIRGNIGGTPGRGTKWQYKISRAGKALVEPLFEPLLGSMSKPEKNTNSSPEKDSPENEGR